jgi:hypothetical protein
MDEMNQDSIEKMRRGYNAPPETPAREMWAFIENRMGSEGPDVIPISSGATRGGADWTRWTSARWMGGVAAAAGILALGIGLGRISVEVTPDGPPARVSAGSAATTLRAATLRHFAKSEALLTLVRNDAREGRLDQDMGRWGRSLLLETRLLKGSTTGQDRVLSRLLDDLELILVQVARLAPEEDLPEVIHEEELGLISEALQQQDIMMRLRSVLPIGAAQAGI